MDMRPAEVEAVLQYARTTLKVLSERALTWASLLGCMVAFGWALHDPHWVRVVAACAYATLVFWPMLKLETKKE